MNGATAMLAALALAVLAAGDAAAGGDTAVVEADRWIVVLSDPRSSRRRGWSTGVGYAGSYGYARDPKLQRAAARLAREHDLEIAGQWPIRALNVHCVVVIISGEPAATLAALRADERVEWVQPMNLFHGAAGDAGAGTDPYRPLQSALATLNVDPLRARWNGRGVRVAMIDSAVEADHPDLAHALARRVDFVGRGAKSERHGTGMAGVMVAAEGNGVGIVGVAPGAELHAYRACWEAAGGGTRCNSLTLSRALDEAVAMQPHIVNMSLTGPEDRLLDRLVDRLLAAGTLVVTANDGRSPRERRFPAPRAGVITVSDGSGVSAAQGDVLYAPGDAVLTSQPGHSYDFMSGASLAAAHVSGVLALMLEAAVPAVESPAMLRRSVRSGPAGASIDACEATRLAHPVIHCR